MLDLAAPIVPGHSAGGYFIGMSAAVALMAESHLFAPQDVLNVYGQPGGTVRCRSASVDLWVANGTISQIGVHGAYRGRLSDAIQLGRTIDDIQRLIGPCREDEKDKDAEKDRGGTGNDLFPHRMRLGFRDESSFAGRVPGRLRDASAFAAEAG